jgi:hypothetical protein
MKSVAPRATRRNPGKAREKNSKPRRGGGISALQANRAALPFAENFPRFRQNGLKANPSSVYPRAAGMSPVQSASHVSGPYPPPTPSPSPRSLHQRRCICSRNPHKERELLTPASGRHPANLVKPLHQPAKPEAWCPHPFEVLCRIGGKSPTAETGAPSKLCLGGVKRSAGCPTLATFLFLSLGWETTNCCRPERVAQPGAPGPSHLGTGETTPRRAPSIRRSLSNGWETTNPGKRVPHPSFAWVG